MLFRLALIGWVIISVLVAPIIGCWLKEKTHVPPPKTEPSASGDTPEVGANETQDESATP